MDENVRPWWFSGTVSDLESLVGLEADAGSAHHDGVDVQTEVLIGNLCCSVEKQISLTKFVEDIIRKESALW